METNDLTLTILQNIRGDIQNVRGDIQDVRGDVAKLDARVDRLEDRFDRLDDKVDELGVKLNGLDFRIGAVETKLVQAGMTLQTVVTHGELGGAVLVLHQRIDVVQGQLLESNVRTNTAHERLQATLDQIKGRL
jgi:chromosome segregation ATPase